MRRRSLLASLGLAAAAGAAKMLPTPKVEAKPEPKVEESGYGRLQNQVWGNWSVIPHDTVISSTSGANTFANVYPTTIATQTVTSGASGTLIYDSSARVPSISHDFVWNGYPIPSGGSWQAQDFSYLNTTDHVTYLNFPTTPPLTNDDILRITASQAFQPSNWNT